MSTFPLHKDNMQALQDMGFDVSEWLDEQGEVTLGSWTYDELVYILDMVTNVLLSKDFKVEEKPVDTYKGSGVFFGSDSKTFGITKGE